MEEPLFSSVEDVVAQTNATGETLYQMVKESQDNDLEKLFRGYVTKV